MSLSPRSSCTVFLVFSPLIGIGLRVGLNPFFFHRHIFNVHLSLMLPLLGESNIDEVFEVGFASLSVAKLLSLIQSAQSCSVFQAKCFCFVRFFKRMRVRRCEKTIICSCWYGLPFRLSTTSKKSILVMSHDIIGAIYLTTSILSTSKTQAASPQLPLMT